VDSSLNRPVYFETLYRLCSLSEGKDRKKGKKNYSKQVHAFIIKDRKPASASKRKGTKEEQKEKKSLSEGQALCPKPVIFRKKAFFLNNFERFAKSLRLTV
jgi:hypothetical protein